MSRHWKYGLLHKYGLLPLIYLIIYFFNLGFQKVFYWSIYLKCFPQDCQYFLDKNRDFFSHAEM